MTATETTASALPPVARFSLRARAEDAAALSAALGLDLPARIGACATVGGVAALKLGPDEWTLQAPEADAGRLAALSAPVPHSLVDVSDRELSFAIRGPRAADLMTIGCPRDLDAVAPGEGRRTVFDGVTVVLWREGPQAFRIDVWRSYAPHVRALLDRGLAELRDEG